MKRKGFTLIELLAVIVILAIIAVIATPIIVGIIEDSRKAAFERSVEGIMHALDLDFGMQEALDNFTYTIKDGIVGSAIRGYEIADFETCKNYLMNEFSETEELAISDCNNEPNPYDGLTITEYAKDDSEFANTLVTAGVLKEIRDEVTVSNTNGINGTIRYDEKGNSIYAIHNGKWCMSKGYNDVTGMLSEDLENCVLPTAESCFTYEDVEGGVEITDYSTSCPRDVVIPSEIDGKMVVSIGRYAFAANQLTSVKLPSNLITIKYAAFSKNLISTIKFPTSIVEISGDAFYNNILSGILDLSDLTNLNTIGGGAFSDNQLTGAIIPDNVVSDYIGNSFCGNDSSFVGEYNGSTFESSICK